MQQEEKYFWIHFSDNLFANIVTKKGGSQVL